MKSKIFIVAAVFFSSQLQAQQDSANQLLDEVVLSASKYPKKQSETGKVITVFNQQTILQMGSRTISEVLNTAAGVTINGANNNLGTNQGVSIRGSSFGNTLILIDGQPVNDPSLISNYFDLNFISLNQVERIEVLKGGQSTLYGSDAVAGVINIITKKAEQKPFSLQATATAGSYSTYQSTLGISGTKDKISYNLQNTIINSKGFSSAYDSTSKNNFDNDGYRQHVLHGDFGFRVNKKLLLKLWSNYSNYKTDIDAAAFTDDGDYTSHSKNIQTGLGVTWMLAGGNLQFNYHYNYLKRNYLNDSADRSNPDFYFIDDNYLGRTHFAELYKNFTWKHWTLLAGTDFRYNKSGQHSVYFYNDFFTGLPAKGESSLDDSIAHTWQLSPYSSLVYNQNNLNVELGARWNYHSVYGNNFTYTFNPSYNIQNKIKLFGNLSSAFKAPTHYQLFDLFAGNKNLQPETSVTAEAGMDIHVNEHLHFRTTYFNRQTKNAIQYVIVDPATYASQYRNVNKQKNNGLETELFFQTKKWNITANYTYTTGKINTTYAESGSALGKDTVYNNLYRVPKHAASAFVTYHILPQLTVSTLVKYMADRFEPIYLSSPVKLDGYCTIDLSAGYRLNKQWRLFADFKNITNKKYFDIFGYNNRRFNMNGGIQFNL